MAKPLALVTNAQEEIENQVASLNVVPDVDFVSLSLRKGLPKRIINLIASANNAELEENEDFYIIKASFIKVVRAELESTTGKLTDGRWRTLFVNRKGEVKEFNSYEFAIGVPRPANVEKEEERKEMVQLNIRIDKVVKDDIEELRKLLGDNYTQNSFVEDALKEFIANIKKEML